MRSAGYLRPRFVATLVIATALLATLAAFRVVQPAGIPPNVPPENRIWYEPVEPLRIAGPIHYVGTRDLAVYLIATPAGHILIDGAMPPSAPLVEANIRKLGFKPQEIRILLTTQAHIDHVGTMAHFKKLTGAQVAVMEGDVPLLKSGGRSDYLFANRSDFHFDPVATDRVLRDQDVVELGGVRLTARLTPGHTRGTTTWTTTITAGGTSYAVVFAGSGAVNPGTRLVKNPSYPGIADDYRRAFALLESLKPDIFLAAHASAFALAAKRARADIDGVQAFVDPDGFRAVIAAQKKSFESLVAKETGAAAPK
jgi:metallo-beta-lactamase class B